MANANPKERNKRKDTGASKAPSAEVHVMEIPIPVGPRASRVVSIKLDCKRSVYEIRCCT